MQLHKLLIDDEAVSPVIAIVLVVAITVILAAVVGGFVITIGNKQGAAPQASFGFEYVPDDLPASPSADGYVVVEHQSGDTFDADNTFGLNVTWESDTSGTEGFQPELPVDATFRTEIGNQGASPVGVEEDSTVRVIWTGLKPRDNRRTDILQEFEVPGGS